MTPRMSVRAAARAVYGELAEEAAGHEARSPLPNPLLHSSLDGERSLAFGERGQTEQGPRADSQSLSLPRSEAAPTDPHSQSSGAASLTTRIRDLYETSAVPVREIARIAGVTERTLYKYVQKHGWKRRYRYAARDETVAAGDNAEALLVGHRQVAPARADIAPAKSAGGRFIRREDIGKPYPTGLKALDPSGRAKALAACGKAKTLSRRAQARAKKRARFERLLRAVTDNGLFVTELRQHWEGPAKAKPSAQQARIFSMLFNNVEWSLQRVEVLLPAAAAMFPWRSRARAEQAIAARLAAAQASAAKAAPPANAPQAIADPLPPPPPDRPYDPDDYRNYGPPLRDLIGR